MKICKISQIGSNYESLIQKLLETQRDRQFGLQKMALNLSNLFQHKFPAQNQKLYQLYMGFLNYFQ